MPMHAKLEELKKPFVKNVLNMEKELDLCLTEENFEQAVNDAGFAAMINFSISGKFKSETNWFSMDEFVGPKPNQYSCTYFNETGKLNGDARATGTIK